MAHGVVGRLDRDGLAVDQDLARVAGVRPEHGPHDLGPARADEARDTQDLAPVELEADVADDPAAVEVADLEHDLLGSGTSGSSGASSKIVRPTIMLMISWMPTSAVLTVSM